MAFPNIGRRAALSLAATAAIVRQATAATALDQPARIVVGGPPGGGSGIVARLMAEQLRGT